MAEDICRKSAIIETYVMDSRRGTTPEKHAEGREAVEPKNPLEFVFPPLMTHLCFAAFTLTLSTFFASRPNKRICICQDHPKSIGIATLA